MKRKVEAKVILRAVIVAIISAVLGSITILLVNSISSITYDLTERFFEAFWMHTKAFVGFCIIILVGVVETKSVAIPICCKIFKIQKEDNTTIKSVLISVAKTIISILLGFVTLYIVFILSKGFVTITDAILELVTSKWKIIFGVLIIVIIGFIEWELMIKSLFWEKNEKKKVLPTEEFDADEVADEILDFLNGEGDE